MNLICKIFGHRAEGYGKWKNEQYLEVMRGAVDGIGRHHASVHAQCDRCNEHYKVGNIHIPGIYVDALNEVNANRQAMAKRLAADLAITSKSLKKAK